MLETPLDFPLVVLELLVLLLESLADAGSTSSLSRLPCLVESP